MPSRLRRVWAFVGLHGLRATVRAVWRLQVHGRQRVVILAAPLPPRLPVAPVPAGISFGAATEDDVDTMPALRVYVRNGEWLHVARDGDRIVAFRRAARTFPEGSMLASVIPPAPHRVFTRETFVSPGYRHRGLGLGLSIAADHDLARRTGARELITAVDAENEASLRMFLRKGARPIRFIDASRCLRAHRYTVSPTMPRDVQQVVDSAAGRAAERREG